MKKTILLLALVSALCAQAQVTTVSTNTGFEWVTWCTYHDLKTDKYSFMVVSDNQYESKQVEIPLGTGIKEALQSLENIIAVYQNYGTNIDIAGHTYRIEALGYIMLKDNSMTYTAGNYHIMNRDVNKAIRTLKKRIQNQ